jgi:hypothetical protein
MVGISWKTVFLLGNFIQLKIWMKVRQLKCILGDFCIERLPHIRNRDFSTHGYYFLNFFWKRKAFLLLSCLSFSSMEICFSNRFLDLMNLKESWFFFLGIWVFSLGILKKWDLGICNIFWYFFLRF